MRLPCEIIFEIAGSIVAPCSDDSFEIGESFLSKGDEFSYLRGYLSELLDDKGQ